MSHRPMQVEVPVPVLVDVFGVSSSHGEFLINLFEIDLMMLNGPGLGNKLCQCLRL